MRPTPLCLPFVLLCSLAAAGHAAEKPLVLDLWPGKPPGEPGDAAEEKMSGAKGSRLLTNVSRPTITVYRPEKEKDNAAAVLVAPGGGYNLLAWDHEGEDVCAWLNGLGVTGVLLKYRVPRRREESRDQPSFGPHQDAQRAMGLVRSKAREWGIDAKRIGMLGFSAGGHLTAMTMTNFDKRGYDAVDEADRVSCRPDFAVLVYPGGVLGKNSDQLVSGIRVTKETPQAFFAHAGDDRVSPENSVQMYLALKRAGVPAELHIYAAGGHGFGMRPGKLPTAEWPKRCEEWMRSRGLLGPFAGK